VSQLLAAAREAGGRGDLATARDRLLECLALDPACVPAYRELAALLARLGFAEEAGACTRLAATHVPQTFADQFEHAEASARLGLTTCAIEHYRSAIALDPRQPAAHNNLGLALEASGQGSEAERAFRAALELGPEIAEIHANLGDVLRRRSAWEEAVERFRTASRLKPDWPEAWNNLGVCLRSLDRAIDAAAAFERATVLRPAFAEAHFNLGNALNALGRRDQAVGSFRRALDIDPRHAEAAYSLGVAATEVEDAGRWYARALESRPDFAEARTAQAFNHFKGCDWSAGEACAQRLRESLDQRPDAAIAPFNVVQLFDDPPLQQLAARRWVTNRIAPWVRGRGPLVDVARVPDVDRLRIGYLSADFRDHAVGRMIADALAAHDRRRFHVTAYAIGPDDGSVIRRKVEQGADVFRESSALGASDLAACIAADGIHILVDLNGHTEHSRSEALALRCAPLQLSYLGYPGTMGATWIDGILTDERLTPAALQPWFDEALIPVPHGYLVSSRAPTAPVPARAALGLPEDGIVFCCFNAAYKIRADTFAAWMRILARVPGSVLWLLRSNDGAVARLQETARRAGIAAERLRFAPPVPYEAHSARIAAADLFLDTWVYAAGATAGQTLAAGVPLLAYQGRGYAARMSAAVLASLGLPELIADDGPQYEARAVELANDRERLAALRARLGSSVAASPLFDAQACAGRLEAAYERIWRARHDPASAAA
jgi:predicted O-linked N-acetylglucosamine transferase (SPINDLY family)